MDTGARPAEQSLGRVPEPQNQPKRRLTIVGWRFVVPVLLAAIVLSALVRMFVVDVYYIPSASMEPLLQTGDRILVSRTDYRFGAIHRGDIVVFDGRGSFAPLHDDGPAVVDAVRGLGQWLGLIGSETVYVKRVVGLPGDHVACCSAGGRVTVNGMPITEPYIHPGDVPSETKFDAIVPADRLWLMGDHRSVSADSRSLLGAPGGGFVPMERVIGRPTAILWPPGRIGPLHRIIVTPGAQ